LPSVGLQWLPPTSPKVLPVASGGPGDRAGLRPGDLLLEVAGHDFTDREAGGAIAKLRPGQKVTLKLRGGETRTVDITPRAVEPAQRF
jgi:S1-C subfamily serine protease